MSLKVMTVGGGRVGAALARRLSDDGHDVVVIELRPDRVLDLARSSPVQVVTGDGTDPDVLEAAGIRMVDVVAVVTGDDARNLVIAALARAEFSVPRTIARIVDPQHAWLFDEAAGVDVAVDQADLLTRLIVEEMSLGEVATLVKLRRGDFTLVEERVARNAGADGRSIAELDLPPACVLVAVLRDDQLLTCRADLVLQAGDEVLAVVHEGAAAQLTRALSHDLST